MREDRMLATGETIIQAKGGSKQHSGRDTGTPALYKETQKKT